jgi:hypothetical protein
MAGVAILALLVSGLRAGEDGEESRGRPRRKGLVVFVLDCSSSMRIPDVISADGTTSTRLEAAISEIGETLEGMREGGEFRFDIVVCSTEIEVFSRTLGLESPPALDTETRKSALSFMANLRGLGMTRMFDAICEGFDLCGRAGPKWKPGTLFLYTDGIPNFVRQSEGPKNLEEFFPEVRAANEGNVRINAYGISTTSEGGSLLKRLCEENGGILFKN